jgi:hypothetical protein
MRKSRTSTAFVLLASLTWIGCDSPRSIRFMVERKSDTEHRKDQAAGPCYILCYIPNTPGFADQVGLDGSECQETTFDACNLGSGETILRIVADYGALDVKSRPPALTAKLFLDGSPDASAAMGTVTQYGMNGSTSKWISTAELTTPSTRASSAHLRTEIQSGSSTTGTIVTDIADFVVVDPMLSVQLVHCDGTDEPMCLARSNAVGNIEAQITAPRTLGDAKLQASARLSVDGVFDAGPTLNDFVANGDSKIASASFPAPARGHQAKIVATVGDFSVESNIVTLTPPLPTLEVDACDPAVCTSIDAGDEPRRVTVHAPRDLNIAQVTFTTYRDGEVFQANQMAAFAVSGNEALASTELNVPTDGQTWRIEAAVGDLPKLSRSLSLTTTPPTLSVSSCAVGSACTLQKAIGNVTVQVQTPPRFQAASANVITLIDGVVDKTTSVMLSLVNGMKTGEVNIPVPTIGSTWTITASAGSFSASPVAISLIAPSLTIDVPACQGMSPCVLHSGSVIGLNVSVPAQAGVGATGSIRSYVNQTIDSTANVSLTTITGNRLVGNTTITVPAKTGQWVLGFNYQGYEQQTSIIQIGP